MFKVGGSSRSKGRYIKRRMSKKVQCAYTSHIKGCCAKWLLKGRWKRDTRKELEFWLEVFALCSWSMKKSLNNFDQGRELGGAMLSPGILLDIFQLSYLILLCAEIENLHYSILSNLFRIAKEVMNSCSGWLKHSDCSFVYSFKVEIDGIVDSSSIERRFKG